MRSTTVVNSKIVYFGSWTEDKSTYILEQKGKRGNLKVRSTFPAIDFINGGGGGGYISSFCTNYENIYFVPWNRSSEVWRMDLETGE